MKYTILGYNQETLVACGLDHKYAQLLQWFTDFHATGTMDIVETMSGKYVWVKYSKIIEDLPILSFKSKKNVAAIFRKMIKCGLFKFHLKKNVDGTFSTYQLNESKYQELLKHTTVDKKKETDATKEESPLPSKLLTKDYSINKTTLLNDDEKIIKSPSAKNPAKTNVSDRAKINSTVTNSSNNQNSSSYTRNSDLSESRQINSPEHSNTNSEKKKKAG